MFSSSRSPKSRPQYQTLDPTHEALHQPSHDHEHTAGSRFAGIRAGRLAGRRALAHQAGIVSRSAHDRRDCGNCSSPTAWNPPRRPGRGACCFLGDWNARRTGIISGAGWTRLARAGRADLDRRRRLRCANPRPTTTTAPPPALRKPPRWPVHSVFAWRSSSRKHPGSAPASTPHSPWWPSAASRTRAFVWTCSTITPARASLTTSLTCRPPIWPGSRSAT